jgi:hypothetical protein
LFCFIFWCAMRTIMLLLYYKYLAFLKS